MKDWQLDFVITLLGVIILRDVVVDNFNYLLVCGVFGFFYGLLKNIIQTIYRGE